MSHRSIAALALLAGLLGAPTSVCLGTDAPRPAEAGSVEAPKPVQLLSVGETAPDFTLADAAGRPVRLADLRGRPVILYFYPMDDTPGCTKEACAFRDDAARYDSLGVRVVGVSTDDPLSHRAFAEKHHLPFTLLADTLGTVAQLYRTGIEIEQGGAKRWIANRVTYLIDAEGVIRQVWPRVNPVGHSAEILAAYGKLTPSKVKGTD